MSVRVDVNEEMKILRKCKKKMNDVYKTVCPNRCLCIKVAKSTMCN